MEKEHWSGFVWLQLPERTFSSKADLWFFLSVSSRLRLSFSALLAFPRLSCVEASSFLWASFSCWAFCTSTARLWAFLSSFACSSVTLSMFPFRAALSCSLRCSCCWISLKAAVFFFISSFSVVALKWKKTFMFFIMWISSNAVEQVKFKY